MAPLVNIIAIFILVGLSNLTQAIQLPHYVTKSVSSLQIICALCIFLFVFVLQKTAISPPSADASSSVRDDDDDGMIHG